MAGSVLEAFCGRVKKSLFCISSSDGLSEGFLRRIEAMRRLQTCEEEGHELILLSSSALHE